MTRPGYRTSAQKAGKSAGQRKRRMARDRKRRNREANVYPISVTPSVINDTRYEDNPIFGIYKEDNTWYLTAMVLKKTREKLVSDRQGAVESKTVDRLVSTKSRFDKYNPSDGIVIDSANKKCELMNKHSINSSTKVESGKYIVYPDQWNQSFKTTKVDREKYGVFRGKDTTAFIY